MAENKKSFVLYADLIHTFETLDNEEAGMLIKHILKYVNDQEPESDNKVVKVAFEPIKQQLKRDLRKYEKIKQLRSDGGKKAMDNRWKKDKPLITPDNSVKPSITNITVNDTVNDNVNDITKTNLIDIFFRDLENSTQFENSARFLGITKDRLKTFIPTFKKKSELSYPSFDRFCTHFKNYVGTQLEKGSEQKVILKSNYGK